MAVVAMGQNVETYSTTQCKFLLILKMGMPVFIGAFRMLGCGLLTYLSNWGCEHKICENVNGFEEMTKIKWPFRTFGWYTWTKKSS